MNARRQIRLTLGVLTLVAAAMFGTAAVAHATDRFVFEKFPPPASEEEIDGNLFYMDEGSEPEPLHLWGQNPSLDPRGRLIAYYEKHTIYVTDFHGRHVEEAVELPESSYAAYPQWIPGGGLIFDGTGDISELELGSSIWTVTPVIGWSGEQYAPAVSPDGKKIAFLSETDPEGNPLPGYSPAVFVADIDGSNVKQLTNSEVISPVSAVSFSPDGKQIAFDAYAEYNEYENSDILSVSVATGEVSRVTSMEGEEAAPDWLPDGRIAFVYHDLSWAETQFMTIEEGSSAVALAPPYTEEEWAPMISGRQDSDLPALTAESQGRANKLLLQFAPTLRYDTFEAYRAMGVSSITNLYSGSETEDSNRLIFNNGTTIAYSNPKLSSPHLSLSFLQPKGVPYPETEINASESHRLVERGSYYEDSANFQEDGSVANRIYGRAVYAEGQWWLQYWFWYYYDVFGLEGFGDHEGDWEMIQVGLGELGNPGATTYAEHHDDEADSCNFDVLDWTAGLYLNVSPVVYVGNGTHASYIRPGTKLGSFPWDEADGEGYTARPLLMSMDVEGWAGWPGRWGNSLGKGESPMAPISQTSRWDEPGAFNEQAESCPREEEGEAQARINGKLLKAPSRPLPPVLSIKRDGASVIVRFRLRGSQHVIRKQGLHVAVLGRRPVVTPTLGEVWHRPKGQLRVLLPNGGGPYEVVGKTMNRAHISSVITRKPLGGQRESGRAGSKFRSLPSDGTGGPLPRGVLRGALRSTRLARRAIKEPHQGVIGRWRQGVLHATKLLWAAPLPRTSQGLAHPVTKWR